MSITSPRTYPAGITADIPSSQEELLLYQFNNMFVLLENFNQSEDKEKDKLLSTFQRYMQEQQSCLTLLKKKNELLEEENVALKERVKILKLSCCFMDCNELIKEIVEEIPHCNHLQKQKRPHAIRNMLLHLGGGYRLGEPLLPRNPNEIILDDKEDEQEYRALLKRFIPRMKHITSAEIGQALKIIYEDTQLVPFITWGGWDVQMTTLTADTIQLLR